ncbi:MAG TPA: hypothetical protein VGY54_14565, partial [Polyangiaceae bacterium]|nr:hypothetical protein [Polyangiaceae bacterium]
MPLEDWIQHCSVEQFFYDWQTVIAGGLAVAAAVIVGLFALKAASIAVQAARQQEGREAEALRLSLTVEVRRLVNILLETHRGF